MCVCVCVCVCEVHFHVIRDINYFIVVCSLNIFLCRRDGQSPGTDGPL